MSNLKNDLILVVDNSGFVIHFHLISWGLYGGAHPVALAMCGHLWNYN